MKLIEGRPSVGVIATARRQGHAEQLERARQRWMKQQSGWDPSRLAFLDESAAKTVQIEKDPDRGRRRNRQSSQSSYRLSITNTSEQDNDTNLIRIRLYPVAISD
jgi:transposase-like protein